jgi:hypothetical protein
MSLASSYRRPQQRREWVCGERLDAALSPLIFEMERRAPIPMDRGEENYRSSGQPHGWFSSDEASVPFGAVDKEKTTTAPRNDTSSTISLWNRMPFLVAIPKMEEMVTSRQTNGLLVEGLEALPSFLSPLKGEKERESTGCPRELTSQSWT